MAKKKVITKKPAAAVPAPARARRPRDRLLWLTLAVVLVLAGWVIYTNSRAVRRVTAQVLPSIPGVPHKPSGGKIVSAEVVRTYSVQEVTALERQNYGNDSLPVHNPVTELLIKYTSLDTDGSEIQEYTRAYIPRLTTDAKIPMLALAPGTTGIGDACAASLEQPAVANWGNYESHAAAYAGQGYAVVIPDYEGMRDSTRIHHYMVGQLEGRAVLDAVRATYSLSDYKNLDPNQLFLAGYSQGGQAVAWADQIAPSYTPKLNVTGVVAFAPVSDITATLAGPLGGSTTTWFGPYLFVSFADYYHQTFPLDMMLQPPWIPNLRSDVFGHCINTVTKFWPNPAAVYTPAFLADLKDPAAFQTNYPDLARDIAQNQPWQLATGTPKLINQGQKDNVILPAQQAQALPTICRGAGPVQLQYYADVTHYNVMVKSFKDTLAWMTKATAGQPLTTSCVGT